MPDWYEDGLVAWLSEGWNSDIDNRVRDGILSGRYDKFNHLTGTDAVDAGHSLWKYIADNHGASAVPDIVHMTKVTRSVENGFLYVIGMSFKNLIADWKRYYMQKYSADESGRYLPGEVVQKKIKSRFVYSQAVIHPEGDKMAYVSNEMGRYKIFLKDLRSGKMLIDKPVELQAADYLPPAGESEKYTQQRVIEKLSERIVAEMYDEW